MHSLRAWLFGTTLVQVKINTPNNGGNNTVTKKRMQGLFSVFFSFF